MSTKGTLLGAGAYQMDRVIIDASRGDFSDDMRCYCPTTQDAERIAAAFRKAGYERVAVRVWNDDTHSYHEAHL